MKIPRFGFELNIFGYVKLPDGCILIYGIGFSVPNIFVCIKSQRWKTRKKHYDAEKPEDKDQIKQPK